jgi:hypothetical protein
MIISKVSLPAVFSINSRSGFLLKVIELAGKKGTDPVFAVCSVCKRWMFYDQDRKGIWWSPMLLDREKIRDTVARFSDVQGFPLVSHGLCLKCEEAALKELDENR